MRSWSSASSAAPRHRSRSSRNTKSCARSSTPAPLPRRGWTPSANVLASETRPTANGRTGAASVIRPPDASASAGSQALLDLRQRGEDDVADDLQAARRDLIEGVFGSMPGGVVEIDDVDRWHAGAYERDVVVVDRRQLVREDAAVTEARGCVPDDVHQPWRGVGVAPDDQFLVANHVEEHERLQRAQRAGLLRRLHVVATAISVVVVATPLDDRFLAVEEDQFDSECVRPFRQRAAELEECRRRRGAITGA